MRRRAVKRDLEKARERLEKAKRAHLEARTRWAQAKKALDEAANSAVHGNEDPEEREPEP